MQRTHQALSAFRASALSTRAPINKRFFTPSAYNMTIKSYFDVTWEGPEVQVDKSGNVTSQGQPKSK
jgi:peptidylprolyl isomerase